MPSDLTAARDHLAIALDTADIDTAVAIARAVQPHIAIAKVGLQLFSAAGRDAVKAVQDTGMDVFLDVKLHDIPNTVRGASVALGNLGVRYLTVHAAGGEKMLRAAVDGLAEGAAQANQPTPTVLAVTILTSEPNATPALLTERLTAAVTAECGGIVCAATDLALIRETAPQITTVVPGIRPAGSPVHDQARVATPAEAIHHGADILVIGRAVTSADNIATAAEDIAAQVAQARRSDQ
ncbi:Orotidine 5'-phosphate decarboxylase [Nocardia otitidiscaviarum]|uniref:Orotidine 5'-phosphate decarboxylase n=1 Tax=Nocardia otitidiscaviarum TaxID=1823 RepID=A0A379JMD1_9NOCA|nr:orotidine-5'-phosphate decarboxylase [Nocardia otitidiscaviarum]SUD49590.1 Orotidine 5'-phosphate decarboxylase [Nocardia otitidiscaviarum]